MVSPKGQGLIEIRVFGFLRRYMDEQGMPYTLERGILIMGFPPIP